MKVPSWVIDELTRRLQAEKENPCEQVCNGTIVSRQQYLKDIHEWGYEDARLVDGVMSEEDIELWTAGIAVDGAK